MAQFGSGRSIIAQNQSAVTDSNGNLIVSPDDSWQGSPLGTAALNQVRIGVPNGTFNLLPANPVATIDSSNPLPYWDLSYDENFVTSMVFDTTTQTWSVQIDPTAVTTVPGTAILKTRIPVTNDDGLDVRQYIASSLVQAVKTAGTDKWTATLTSQYYDATGAAIGTPYIIGTIGERGTATVLGSYTNASGPISLTAAELELAYKVVVSTASPTYVLKIKSVMAATEFGVIGGGGAGTAYVPLSTVTTKGDLIVASGSAAVSRLGTAAEGAYLQVDSAASTGLSWKAFPNNGVSWIVQTFTSSGTWTKPAGVNYVTVVAMGGGQGGASGVAAGSAAVSVSVGGGVGGATGSWTILENIYVTGNVSVGIGAGGAGGSATVTTKAAAATTQYSVASVAGAQGAATTFGSYLSVGGGAGTTVTSTYWNATSVAGTTGGTAPVVGSNHAISAFTSGAPYTTFVSSGVAGTAGTATGSSSDAAGAGGTANASAGLGGGGGFGGGATAATAAASTGTQGGRGGSGGSGSGGGGAGSSARVLNQTIVTSGGPGAAGSANSGAGGGGGGGAAISSSTAAIYNSAAFTLTTGKGGDGGSGWLVVAYPAIGQ